MNLSEALRPILEDTDMFKARALERLIAAMECVFISGLPNAGLDNSYQTWVDFVREERADSGRKE